MLSVTVMGCVCVCVCVYREGKLELEMDWFVLHSMLASVTDTFAKQFERKRLTLNVIIDPQLPASVRGDVNALRRVLANLISNACKFSHDGGTITVAAQRVGANQGASTPPVQMPSSTTSHIAPSTASRAFFMRGSAASYASGDNSPSSLTGPLNGSALRTPTPHTPAATDSQGWLTSSPHHASSNQLESLALRDDVRVSVSDTGIGVAPDEVPLLFTPFNQLKAGAAQKGNVTGLGLALSKCIVDLSGGSIGVHSASGAGSTFFFDVPIAGAMPVSASDFASLQLPFPGVVPIQEDAQAPAFSRGEAPLALLPFDASHVPIVPTGTQVPLSDVLSKDTLTLMAARGIETDQHGWASHNPLHVNTSSAGLPVVAFNDSGALAYRMSPSPLTSGGNDDCIQFGEMAEATGAGVGVGMHKYQAGTDSDTYTHLGTTTFTITHTDARSDGMRVLSTSSSRHDSSSDTTGASGRRSGSDVLLTHAVVVDDVKVRLQRLQRCMKLSHAQGCRCVLFQVLLIACALHSCKLPCSQTVSCWLGYCVVDKWIKWRCFLAEKSAVKPY